jgi:hypothetical protein
MAAVDGVHFFRQLLFLVDPFLAASNREQRGRNVLHLQVTTAILCCCSSSTFNTTMNFTNTLRPFLPALVD